MFPIPQKEFVVFFCQWVSKPTNQMTRNGSELAHPSVLLAFTKELLTNLLRDALQEMYDFPIKIVDSSPQVF